MTLDSIIVGGGIAGCSAAIHLARRGHRVLLLEQKRYPAAKLCGEFLSIEASSYLERLGVLPEIFANGAQSITQLKITASKGASLTSNLPGTALGFSRRSLDQMLIQRARAVGAECREGVNVESITGSAKDGFTVSGSGEQFSARTVFGAYGKRSGLDETSFTRPRQSSPFVAFKCHFSGKHAPNSIEIFSFSGGYVGFAPVEEGMVNACFITHRRALDDAGGHVEEFIKATALENPALGLRLEGLVRVDHLIGCSNISFRIKSTFENGVCMIGDTAGMIAPLCGDGMSMAMRSAEMAAECASEYLSGRTDAAGFQSGYTAMWRREFRLRLLVGRCLQEASQYPAVASGLIRICNLAPFVRDSLIHATRGRPARISAHSNDAIPAHEHAA